MNLFIKLQKHRREKVAAHGRRSRKVLRLEPESLENRTPMSSGLASALESIVMTRAAEIGLALQTTRALVSTSVIAGDSEQAVSTFESELDSANGVLAVTESTLPLRATASENDQSNEPGVSEASPAIPPDDRREFLTLDSLQATSDSASGGGNVRLAAVEASGTTVLGAELHEYVVNSMFGPGGDDGNMLVPPLMGVILEPLTGRVSPQTSTSDDDSDISYSGPLEPILATTDPADFSETTPSTGRTSTPAFTGRSLQLDSYGEYSNSSGLSYLAAGQGAALAFQSSADDDLLAWEESTAEPMPPGSITTGGLSLTNLLSGPDALTRPDPDAVVQVAELVPLPESSLALAATLWTVPSDSPTSSLQWHPAVETATDANARAGAVSSWMLFVAGVDEALEQTCRDLQENIPTTKGRQHDGNPNSPDELLEWQGPILPGTQRALPETHTKLPDTRRGQSDGGAGHESAPTRRAARPSQGDGQAVMLAAMPTISVVSVFTAIATWIWRKRQQWRPSSFSGPVSGRRRIRGSA